MDTKTLLLIGAVIIFAGVFWWFCQDIQTTGDVSSTSYQNVSAEEFNSILESRNVFVLDTHTPKQEHIKGTDAFIPYNEIEDNIDKLPKSKDSEILVYCRSGNMSETASETLVSLGYTNVKNLLGGKKAYAAYLNESNGFSITPTNQELGTVIYGDVEETVFTIANNTNQVVNLTRVSTSCGCTKAFPEKNVLEPGESIGLKVTFDPAVHKDDTDLGELTRTIYVQTDHPSFPSLENTITANVVKP